MTYFVITNILFYFMCIPLDTKTLKEKDIDGTTIRSQTEDEEGSVDEDDSSEDENEDDSDGDDEDGSDDDNTANSEDEYDTDE